jgi:protein-S-isoprenylcysteine O-methyltransferase Ste14
MTTWSLLHVLSMFIAFALTTGVGIAATAIAGTRDVRAIRAAAKIAQPLQMAGAMLLILGIIFGFFSARAADFDLASTWLAAGAACALLLVIIGVAVHRVWLLKLAKAAASSPDDRPSAELNAVIDDKLARAAGPVSGLLWIIAIAMMVLKP